MVSSIIALIDDDNIPMNNWFKNIYVNKNINCKEISTNKKKHAQAFAQAARASAAAGARGAELTPWQQGRRTSG